MPTKTKRPTPPNGPRSCRMTDRDPHDDNEALQSGYDTLLLDLDGTVYQGARAVPGAAEAITGLRELEIPVRFVTNNASKGPQEVVEHLRTFGIVAGQAEVNTSAQAAAKILRAGLSPGATVMVVGAPALEAEVE